MSQTFTFVFSDTGGAGDLLQQFVLFNTSLALASSCLPVYGGSTVYLMNDAVSGWLGPITLGSSSTLSNSQCTISGSGSSVSLSGNTLTLTLAISFSSAFAGGKTIYIQTNTREGLDTSMQARGSWTIP
jgi:hypothetical protein